MNKTIYFLGAGFSKDAGGPVQNEMIKTILSEEFNSVNCDRTTQKAYKQFIDFIKKELLIDQSNYENIALEDIFTPIDRCISEERALGHYTYKELIDLREKLHYLLAKSIQFNVEKEGNNKHYIDSFAKYVNNIAKRRIKDLTEDNIAIITTNWDILLDNSLNNAIIRNKENPGVVDYCCNINPLDNEDKELIKPGLIILGEKGYNIKYLKLHGSMNWLHCPYCQRLYVKFDKKTMFDKRYCRHCNKNLQLKKNDSIQLRGNLLLPTFLKDIRNIQLQLIWQNAGIELSEASKIVFIGYSLPQADFEIRQLLTRFVRKDANIEVILCPTIDTQKEETRYKTFFGHRNIKIRKISVPDYVNELTQQNGDFLKT